MIFNAQVLLSFFSIWVTIEALGQKVDSPRSILLAKYYDRWNSHYRSSIKFADQNNQVALCYADSAQELVKNLGDSLLIVKTHRVKGQILLRLDKTKEAVQEFQKTLVISKRNNFVGEQGYALNGLALAYTFQANYDKALQLHFECLVIREKEGDCEEICTTLNNIGLVYYKLGNYEKALEYYAKAHSRSLDVYFNDHLLVNMGLCYNYLNNFPTAIKFIDQGMKHCGSKCSDVTMMGGELGLGIAHFNLGRSKEAENHFRVSYKLARKQRDKRYQIENLIYLGRVKNGQGLYGAAKEFLKDAESIAAETQYNELLINLYKQFAELYTRTKDYRNATLYQGKYIMLGESVHNEQLMQNLMRIHTEYEERDNKTKIASQGQILELKEDAILRQQFLNILIGVIAIMFVGLAIVLYKINRQKQHINVLLDQKVKERTLALEDSLYALKRTKEEQEDVMRKASTDLKSSIATIEGLCVVAYLDPETPERYRKYLKEFDATASRLSNLISRLRFFNNGN